MNFDGFQPQAIPRWGSIVQSDDTTELPLGIADDVQNCAFRAQSVGPRDGKAIKLTFGAKGNAIGGLGVLRYLAPDNSGQESIKIIAATQDGNVWGASPFLQSSVQTLTVGDFLAKGLLTLSTGLYAQCCQAYNKMYIAQGNLMMGVAPPLIVDGATLTCDPLSDKPFGDTWLPSTTYRIGQVVSSTVNTATGLYYCQTAGISGTSDPIGPTSAGATVIDGSGAANITWQRLDIVCTSGLQPPAAPIANGTASGSTIPAGATLFLVCTWTNQYGESVANVVNPDGTIGNVLQWKNTSTSAVNLKVVLPLITPDIAALPSQYAVTGCNLYGYLATGTPNSDFYLDPTAYALIASGGAPGASLTISTLPIGQQLPTYNNAFTTPAGNVSSGTRYMIVLYMTRTGYICGFNGPAPIRCDISGDSRQMFVQNLPIGPYNCVARICAFTVAGQGSAGPYFYIDSDDYEDPGMGAAKILQTATKIPDNVTTSAYFDFNDSYLPGASDVTDYFDRIEVPPCSDVYFSKSLNRVVYAGAIGYPSAVLISDLEDGEAIRIPGSEVDVSETDGDRVVCMRDIGTVHLIYKENSAHILTPNDGDPSDWDVTEEWSGSGPCGPRAIAVSSNDGEKLHAYAHRSGGYTYNGSGAPNLVTRELQGTPEDPGLWDRINWSHSYLIRTTIDIKNRLIFFFVPLDGATANNCRITVNYYFGLDDPIVYIQRTGREVPNINGRKWSLDSIQANDCVYVPQRTSGS